MYIAMLKETHEVTADDGCAGAWAVGDTIRIEPGSGSLDYVRKGVMVELQDGHFHVIPASKLSFFLPGDKTPTNTDRVFGGVTFR